MKSCFKPGFILCLGITTVFLSISGTSTFAAALFQEEGEVEEALTEEEYEAHVEQTDAYMACINEEDSIKRGDCLIAFLEKYPDSSLVESHIKPAYAALMAECYQNQKYQELETLAEKWLELFPGNKQTISFAATAAAQLEHNEKYLKYLLILYEMEPTSGGARIIAELYDKTGDFENFVKWCEITFTYPEYSVDYSLRYKILTKYAEAGNMAKATEYAQKTIEVLDAAPKPDAAGVKVMQAIRHECYHLIAINDFEEQKYEEALDYFDRALKIKKFQDGFYYMAQCYWRLGEKKRETDLLEKAHDYFAAAEIMGGGMTDKAKEYKEDLYKSQHNGNLTGIGKVDKRGQDILDAYSNPSDTQKKTDLAQELN